MPEANAQVAAITYYSLSAVWNDRAYLTYFVLEQDRGTLPPILQDNVNSPINSSDDNYPQIIEELGSRSRLMQISEWATGEVAKRGLASITLDKGSVSFGLDLSGEKEVQKVYLERALDVTKNPIAAGININSSSFGSGEGFCFGKFEGVQVFEDKIVFSGKTNKVGARGQELATLTLNDEQRVGFLSTLKAGDAHGFIRLLDQAKLENKQGAEITQEDIKAQFLWRDKSIMNLVVDYGQVQKSADLARGTREK